MSRTAPLSSFRIRPRFEDAVALDPVAVRAQITRALAAQAPGLVVRSFPEFIGIHLADQERHYWSPRLFLSLEPAPDGATRITGIYGPEIEVWSVFLYGYLITGLLGTLSGILGGAQLFIGEKSWGFWVTGGMAGIAALLYCGAQLGQKFGAVQTCQLHKAYQAALGRPAQTAAGGPAQASGL